MAAARKEIELWTGRVDLAASKGLADLETAALAKARRSRERVQMLEAERAEIAGKIVRIREKLPMVKATEQSWTRTSSWPSSRWSRARR